MLYALINLALFAAKALIILFIILICLVFFFVLLAKNKDKLKGRLIIKNINDKYEENKEILLG